MRRIMNGYAKDDLPAPPGGRPGFRVIAELYRGSEHKCVENPCVPIRKAIGFQPCRIELQVLSDLAPDMTPPRRHPRLDNVYTVYRQFGGVAGGSSLHSRTPSSRLVCLAGRERSLLSMPTSRPAMPSISDCVTPVSIRSRTWAARWSVDSRQ